MALLPAGAAPRSGDVIPGRYIVRLAPGVEAGAIAERHGLKVEHQFKKALRGFSGVGEPGKLAALQKDPGVEAVEPDRYVEAFAQVTPTGVNRVDADLSGTAKIDGVDDRVDADIAIIDTGMKKHGDLNVVGGYNCTGRNTNAWDDGNGHGTHVAGTAAAKDDGNGVVGVAPGARLQAVKVLSNAGYGYLSWVICGVDYVTRNAGTIDVANMSLGGEFTSPGLNSAIANSVASGVTYVVAAGNSAKDAATFSPANHPDVVTVSALADSDGKCGGSGPATSYGADDTLASFSNFGPLVEISAPGVNILSTYKKGFGTLSGTSMASPHVAGAAALFIAKNGRDVTGDGIVNGADVAAIRAALISASVAQTEVCNTAAGDGFGGFTGDPDGSPEPLLSAKTF